MLSIIENKIISIRGICKKTGVKRLHIFGSASKGGFSQDKSDLDFLVDFKTMPPVSHAKAYFDLVEGF
ncbi:MAG: nucleotidyltransferase domain-containing protein [Nitrospinae bacterium]|nr:nucleotidyltransferase domain-containing protein [Nitrospinota bacterium]